ncbi:hypothetical protein [uncultured Friedmanniella sp.]|uniref:hypothetical protein n=1 Tax=uncultured Friedmanniella sp. TaxID=335381 RepID=UPI0035CBED53
MSRTPSSRTATIAKIAVIPVALIASGLVVSQASYSAYSASTSNPTSNWSSGTVQLSDDDSNAALFSASNLKPGATGTKCIVVTSSGSLASTVKLYAASVATTKALASSITLNVTQGSGGSFGSCTGFTPAATNPSVFSGTLESFGTTATSFATGLGSWAPTGTATESRTYQVSYTLAANAPDSTQGGTASVALTWEAQNS